MLEEPSTCSSKFSAVKVITSAKDVNTWLRMSAITSLYIVFVRVSEEVLGYLGILG